MSPSPAVSTIVVSWRSREETLALARAFRSRSDRELVVVDNSGELEGFGAADGVRLVVPGRNLGFAGGANRGAREAAGAVLFFLNPDAVPSANALDELVVGFERHPGAAGLVPRLLDERGCSQHRWQLRPLPSAPALLAHAFFWSPTTGPRSEPAAGTEVAQPAAAALAVRREAFEGLGGFDAGFYPAWFEDVDFAKRLAVRGGRFLYWPSAEVRHRGGGSLSALGYAGFLNAYDRNLARYLGLHHGRGWALAFRALVPLGALVRIAALPLRCPQRASGRGAATRALTAVARAALRGWPDGEAVE